MELTVRFTSFNENNKKKLNIFVALGEKDIAFPPEMVKKNIKAIIGERENLIIKEYASHEHDVYDDQLEDMRNFISKLIN